MIVRYQFQTYLKIDVCKRILKNSITCSPHEEHERTAKTRVRQRLMYSASALIETQDTEGCHTLGLENAYFVQKIALTYSRNQRAG